MYDTNKDKGDFEILEIKDWVIVGQESTKYPRNKYRYVRGKAIVVLNRLAKPKKKRDERLVILKNGDIV